MRKKIKFLARKIQEIQEILQYNLLGLLNFFIKFFGHFMEIHKTFWPGGKILIKFLKFHFYVIIFFRNLRLKSKSQKFSIKMSF